MDDIPIHITRIRLLGNKYEVLYNGTWKFINTFDQIKDMSWNFEDVEDILISYERIRKINKIMNLNNKIYKDNKVIYQKNDY